MADAVHELLLHHIKKSGHIVNLRKSCSIEILADQ